MKNSFFASLALLGLVFVSLEQNVFAQDENAIVTTDDNQKLTARWTLPQGETKGVVIILPGFGGAPVSWNGDVSSAIVGSGYKGASAKLSDQLAYALESQHVASLRYSRRGSDDASLVQTAALLIADAKAALKMAQLRFPKVKSGIVGFSEGGTLATFVASEVKVDQLFLLATPTRSYDEMLAYQFTQWPVDLLRRQLDPENTGSLSPEYLKRLGTPGSLPILTAFTKATWQTIDQDKNGAVSVASELIPAYQSLYAAAMGMFKAPPLADWYLSFKNLAPFSEVAAKINTPVHLYQALEDGQVHWSWVVSDQRYFAGKTELRLFSGLGHCFSPLEGPLGEVKTSGPFSDELLKAVSQDAGIAFK